MVRILPKKIAERIAWGKQQGVTHSDGTVLRRGGLCGLAKPLGDRTGFDVFGDRNGFKVLLDKNGNFIKIFFREGNINDFTVTEVTRAKDALTPYDVNVISTNYMRGTGIMEHLYTGKLNNSLTIENVKEISHKYTSLLLPETKQLMNDMSTRISEIGQEMHTMLSKMKQEMDGMRTGI